MPIIGSLRLNSTLPSEETLQQLLTAYLVFSECRPETSWSPQWNQSWKPPAGCLEDSSVWAVGPAIVLLVPFPSEATPVIKKKKKESWLVASRFNSCLSAQHKYFSHSYLKSAAANQFVFVWCSSTRAVTFLYVSRSCILTSPLFRLQWKCSQQQAEGIL